MVHGEVTAITSRRGSKRCEVQVDTDHWATMPSSVVKALGLQVGDIITLDDVVARRLELEPQQALERALRLLAYRERSCAEIAERLTEDGYLQEVVAGTLSWLTKTGLLDDMRLAEQMAHSLISLRGFGRQRALVELRRLGIDQGNASHAIDTVAPPQEEERHAHEMARRLSRPSDTADRLAARLVRRGFSVSDALKAARSCVPSDEPVEPDETP